MKKPIILLFALAVVFGCSPKKDDQATVFKKINEEVLANSRAYETLEEATKTIGHRLTGSEEGAKAEE